MKAAVRKTTYAIVDDELVTTEVDTEVEVLIYTVSGLEPTEWLSFAHGPQSINLTYEDRIRAEGWQAQTGTPPVKVDGRWGGRNYSGYFMPAEEVCRVLDELRK